VEGSGSDRDLLHVEKEVGEPSVLKNVSPKAWDTYLQKDLEKKGEGTRRS